MKYFWISNPLLRVLVPFAIGIATSHMYTFSIAAVILAVGFLIIINLLLNQIRLKNQLIYLLIQSVVFLILGNTVANIHNEASVTHVDEIETLYVGTIESKNEVNRFIRYKFIDTRPLGNKNFILPFNSLLYVKKSENEQFKLRDKCVFRAKFNPIKGKNNVLAFDFKKYWNNKGINWQAFIEPSFIHLYEPSHTNFIERLRKTISETIDQGVKSDEARGIAKALMLGDKRTLDPEIKQIYRDAGAMHVLAVSGLHVGIIFLLFNLPVVFLRKVLKRDFKWLGLLTLIPIWIFALICNLTPAVFRAALMISFLVVSQCRSVKYSSLNILAIVAFMLLLLNPNLLFDVGFQFSFLAVLGIVLCYAPINKKLTASNYFISKLWSMVAVTLSAQIFLFPMLLYYFHQFPIYFIPNSIISVFSVFYILLLGTAMVLFGHIAFLLKVFGYITEVFILWLNKVLGFMVGLPMTLIEDVWISPSMLIVLFLFSLSISLYLNTRKPLFGYLCALSILLFSSLYAFHEISNRNQDHLVVYSDKGRPVVGVYVQGRGYEISKIGASDFLTSNMHSYLHQDQVVDVKSNDAYMDSLAVYMRGVLQVGEKRILFLNRSTIDYTQHINGLNIDYIIVNNVSPEIVSKLLNQNHVKNIVRFCEDGVVLNGAKSTIEVCEEGWIGVI